MDKDANGIVLVEEIPSGSYKIENGRVSINESDPNWVISDFKMNRILKKKKKSTSFKIDESRANLSKKNANSKISDKKQNKIKIKRKLKKSNSNTSVKTSSKSKTSKTVDLNVIENSKFIPNLKYMKAWNNFGLDTSLIYSLQELKFNVPTEIQRISLRKSLLQQRDILGCAETGSGKTLAYGLPILNYFTNTSESFSKLPALIFAPTRELAMQICQHLNNVLNKVNLKKKIQVTAIVGGMSETKQERLLLRKPSIIVATPGRFGLFLRRQNDFLDSLAHSLKFLVFDEADRLFAKGHFPDLKHILRNLANAGELTYKRQTFMFSATLMPANNVEERSKLESIMEELGLRGKPAICKVQRQDRENISNVTHDLPKSLRLSYLVVPETEKLFHLLLFVFENFSAYLKDGFKVVIFVNAIYVLKKLVECLKLLRVDKSLLDVSLDISIQPLHANMQQRQRLKNLDRFKESKHGILVTTDVSARGLDVKNLDCVINYDLPRNLQPFIHRAGRTARAGENGICFSLVKSKDESYFNNQIKKVVPNIVEHRTLVDKNPSFDNLERYKLFRHRVQIVKKLEKVQFENTKVAKMKKWYEEKSDAIEVDIDEDILKNFSGEHASYKTAQNKKKIIALKKDLANSFGEESRLVNRKRKFFTINQQVFD